MVVVTVVVVTVLKGVVTSVVPPSVLVTGTVLVTVLVKLVGSVLVVLGAVVVVTVLEVVTVPTPILNSSDTISKPGGSMFKTNFSSLFANKR